MFVVVIMLLLLLLVVLVLAATAHHTRDSEQYYGLWVEILKHVSWKSLGGPDDMMILAFGQ